MTLEKFLEEILKVTESQQHLLNYNVIIKVYDEYGGYSAFPINKVSIDDENKEIIVGD